MDAYSHLLDILGITEDFEEVTDVPAIKERIDYLDEVPREERERRHTGYVMSLLLFSMFVEHVSLFSQFLIMTSFDKHEKKFKGNHERRRSDQQGGADSRTVRCRTRGSDSRGESGPLRRGLRRKRSSGLSAGVRGRDEDTGLDLRQGRAGLPSPGRRSTRSCGTGSTRASRTSVSSRSSKPDEGLLEETRWFDEDIMMTKDNDFFSKRSTTYNKHAQSVTAEDMF